MKSHGILMSGPMVQAILDGRKTQTRRVSRLEDVNQKPEAWTFKRTGVLDFMTNPKYKGCFGAYFESEVLEPRTINICPVSCPYGQSGDHLWVREAFDLAQPHGSVDDEWIGDELMEWDGPLPKEKPDDFHWWNLYYRADEPEMCSWWRPSIFMPRWASRITLEIIDIRVQRVQEITREDAFAEGVRNNYIHQPPDWIDIDAYHELWDKLNAKRGYGWHVNPFVWVINFRRVEDGHQD